MLGVAIVRIGYLTECLIVIYRYRALEYRYVAVPVARI